MKNTKLLGFKFQIVFILGIIILYSGCGLTKGLRAIKNKDVKTEHYTFNEKSIIFTPLAHFSQVEYYENLKDSIINWKKKGYMIFYEGIIHKATEMNVDSIVADRTMRKWRKITRGVGATREDYAELSDVFKNAIVQPENEELGIDSADVNADITLLDLVSKYEDYYGKIHLDSCDLITSLDSTYACKKKLKGNLNPVILDYRNVQLVEKLVASEQKKIVVLYGARHIKGMKKLLKKEVTTSTNVP